jgi:hypothetical protein
VDTKDTQDRKKQNFEKRSPINWFACYLIMLCQLYVIFSVEYDVRMREKYDTVTEIETYSENG